MIENDKILKGLLSDGMETVHFSYQLIISKKSKDVTVGMTYLNQANTFFTIARTFYYQTRNYNDECSLIPLFYSFGRYNYHVLNFAISEKKTEKFVIKSYLKLLNEYQGI